LRILQFGVEDDVPFLVMEYASTPRQLTIAVHDEVLLTRADTSRYDLPVFATRSADA
jgi:hypothetical protein